MRRPYLVAVVVFGLTGVVVLACSKPPTSPVLSRTEATGMLAGAHEASAEGLAISTQRDSLFVAGRLLEDPFVQHLWANLEDPAAFGSVWSSREQYEGVMDGSDWTPVLDIARVQLAQVEGSRLSADDEVALAVLRLLFDVEAAAMLPR